jgi:hypothetical protein
MARDFLNLEATPKNPSFEYQCVTPNDDIRSVIQIDVAIDGIAIVVEEGGAADLCIQAAPSIVETNTVDPVTPDRSIEQSEFFTPNEPNSPPKPELERSLSNERVKALELELQYLLSKMTRKDKVISDLQRQLTHSESQRQVSETNLTSCQQELRRSREETLLDGIRGMPVLNVNSLGTVCEGDCDGDQFLLPKVRTGNVPGCSGYYDEKKFEENQRRLL